MTKQTKELTIRQSIPEDAQDLIQFIEKVKDQTTFFTFSSLPNFNDVQKQKDYIEGINHSDNKLLLVARTEEEIAGVLTVSSSNHPFTQHIGEIGIIIDEDYWRQGLGTLLFEKCLYWAEKESKIYRLELFVQVRNDRAITLYENSGFEVDGRIERGVYIDGEFMPVLLMSKLIH